MICQKKEQNSSTQRLNSKNSVSWGHSSNHSSTHLHIKIVKFLVAEICKEEICQQSYYIEYLELFYRNLFKENIINLY